MVAFRSPKASVGVRVPSPLPQTRSLRFRTPARKEVVLVTSPTRVSALWEMAQTLPANKQWSARILQATE